MLSHLGPGSDPPIGSDRESGRGIHIFHTLNEKFSYLDLEHFN